MYRIAREFDSKLHNRTLVHLLPRSANFMTPELVAVWRREDGLLVEVSAGDGITDSSKRIYGVTLFRANGTRLPLDRDPSQGACFESVDAAKEFAANVEVST